MADEMMNNEQQEPLNPEEALAKLMRDSVPKEKYDALQKQYNDFFNKVANGHFTDEEAKEQEPTEDEKQQAFFQAIDKLYNRKTHGSVEFMENALIIDNYLVSHGQRSAFAPSRGDVTPDIDSVTEAVNATLQSCVDQSNGSDSICSAHYADSIDTKFMTGSRS